MMHSNGLKDALARRRARSMDQHPDVTIEIDTPGAAHMGHAEEEQAQGGASDMAPNAPLIDDEQAEQRGLAPSGAQDPEAFPLDSHMLSGMTDHDQDFLRGVDPKGMSLGQRARMDAMKRNGK